jgi:hypothetical protein
MNEQLGGLTAGFCIEWSTYEMDLMVRTAPAPC